jgi:hypothetical protein
MFRNRIAFAIIGAVLIGSVSGIMAGMANIPRHANTTIAQTVTDTPAPIATATTQDDTPTAIPTRRSATPRPTATASATPAPGQSADLHAHIGVVDSAGQSFSFTPFNGSAITVKVTSGTQYQNVAGFSSLRSSMRAEVKGVYQTSSTLVATLVNVSVNN